MSPPGKNTFALGQVPHVVGTVTTRAGLDAFLREHRASCDLVEVRLDEIGVFAGWPDACKRIEAAGCPVMLTLRSTRDGGKCGRTRDERRAILSQAAECASLVDAEYNSDSLDHIAAVVKAAGKMLVASYHDFACTPAQPVFARIIAEATPHASIVKIAVMVNGDSDLATLDAVLGEKRSVPLCLIGMGARGTRTRTDYPAAGSCLTYGYLDSISAPGQLSARQLVAHLTRNLPGYAAAYASRH